MKFITFYRRLIGILVFLFLSGLSIFFGFFIVSLDINEVSELIACLLSSLVIFFGLHYITLTAFGFVDSENRLMRVALVLRLIPFLIVITLVSVSVKEYFDFYRQYIASLPVDYDSRLEIMNSTELTLGEKLTKLKMNTRNNIHEASMKISIEENSFRSQTKKGEDLASYYTDFSLSKEILEQLTKRHINDQGNRALLSLANGQTLTVRDQNDSILGYLQSRDVFVLKKTSDDHTIRFQSISRLNGNRLQGIPLFPNNSMRFFADLNLLHRRNTADLQISIWRKSRGDYNLRHHETIPLGMYHTTLTKSVIKNIRWQSDSLMFDFVTKDQNQLKAVAFTLSESRD